MIYISICIEVIFFYCGNIYKVFLYSFIVLYVDYNPIQKLGIVVNMLKGIETNDMKLS